MCGCPSHAPYWGPGPQPRHVPWQGTEPVIVWFAGWHSIHWAIPARAYFIVYANTVVPIFPSLCPSTQTPHPHPQAIPTLLSWSWIMDMCSSSTLFPVLYLHPHDYFVTTNLCFLIPSTSSPIFPNRLPSGNHQSLLCIYDSVSVLLVCLFCFLDLIVDREELIAILLFIFFFFFFFFFFLKNTL